VPGRNSQVARFFALIDLLERNPAGLTTSELWEALKDRGHEAGRRTIYRDLEGLTQAGLPVFTDRTSKDGGAEVWRMDRVARVGQYLALTARELFALHLARGSLAPLKETAFFEDLNRVFEKIEARLGGRAVQYLSELKKEFHFDPAPQWGLSVAPDILDTLRAGCSEGQVVEMVYRSIHSGTERLRRIGPHYLYFSKGGLYLIGEDLESKTVKAFALPRVIRAVMTDETYEGSVTDPAEFFQSSLGVYRKSEPQAVKIRVGKKIAPFISERCWHPSQRITHLREGGIDLHLDVAITPDLVQWILGLGAEAEVISPLELRDSILRELDQISARYKKSA